MRWLFRRSNRLDELRGPLHSESDRRDWLLFALAALMPAIAVGVLGLRALANEEAATRRSLELTLSAEAASASRRIEQALTESARALALARFDDESEKAAPTLAAIAPPFAEPVLLAANRSLLVPRPPPAATTTAPARCRELARAITLARREDERATARKEMLERCVNTRDERGRFLWPVVALDALARGEQNEIDGATIAAWLEQHAAQMSELEREATRLEIEGEAKMPAAARERASAALTGARSLRSELERELGRDAAAASLRAPPDPSGLVAWRGGTSTGTLRALEDGRLAGFVVLAASLEAALARGALRLPADTRAEVITSNVRPPGADNKSIAALVEVAPTLWIRLSPANPSAIAESAATRRWVLGAIGFGATALAFALAAILFARMRAAKRSSELRTDFVSTVSHELRTPIAGLRLLAELLEEERIPPEEQRELIEALGREARRLGETVDRLLGFGRMAAGRYVIERVRMRVADAVKTSIDAFEEQHPELPRVILDLDEEAEARIDAGQIRLLCDNLLANAHKYAPEGGPYRVSVARRDGAVILAVADRGPGVAKRDQKRIFEPFERVDNRLSRATSGSGIGLSLVRHVAEAHGGKAYVESELGRGATFLVRIPALEGEEQGW